MSDPPATAQGTDSRRHCPRRACVSAFRIFPLKFGWAPSATCDRSRWGEALIHDLSGFVEEACDRLRDSRLPEGNLLMRALHQILDLRAGFRPGNEERS